MNYIFSGHRLPILSWTVLADQINSFGALLRVRNKSLFQDHRL